MSLLSRISPLFISALLAAAGTLLPVGTVFASTITYYTLSAYPDGRFPSADAACASLKPASGGYRVVSGGTNCQTQASAIDPWRDRSFIYGPHFQQCEFGNTGLFCNTSCSPPKQMVGGQCITPELPQCESGQFYDFDSKSCKWPQDDTCSVIGASWDNNAQSCKCSIGQLLVTAGGVSRCMVGVDEQQCFKTSPDFKGYGPSGAPICSGSARCPNGGSPGYVGSGDQTSFICIPPIGEGEGDGSCNGTPGIMNGVRVCVPKPGTDPDLPDCKGVVGKVGNQKVCVEPATNDSRCKPGETAGYTGVGAEMNFVCVPKGYGPETCPPGQYVINKEAEGFGCAIASNEPPENEGKKPGSGTSESETTKKDANGNEIGKDKTETKFEIEGLFHDAPANNFKSEMDQFGKSALDGLNTDTLVGEFSGSDGAFTQRNSLDNASSFIKTHTVGNNASCSGTLPFLGYDVSCAKFENMNRVLGWLLFVVTVLWIYNTLMRKSESGV